MAILFQLIITMTDANVEMPLNKSIVIINYNQIQNELTP